MKTRYVIFTGFLGIAILGIAIFSSIARQTPPVSEETPNASNPTEKIHTYNDIKSQLYDGDAGVSQEIDPYDLSSIDIHAVRLFKVKLLGVPNLTEKLYEKMDSITVVQRDIVAALLRYGEDHLKGAYSTLVIIPSSVKVTGSSVKMSLNLGETDKRVDVSVTVLHKLRASTVIGDENKPDQDLFIYAGGIYDTDYGVPVTGKDLGFSIKQQGYTRNLVINAIDKEKALGYISSLGYKIPDFHITFTNHRSAFE